MSEEVEEKHLEKGRQEEEAGRRGLKASGRGEDMIEEASEIGGEGGLVERGVEPHEAEEGRPPSPELRKQPELSQMKEVERPLRVPIIRIEPPPEPSILLTSFDLEIRKPSRITLPRVMIPIYRKDITPLPNFLLESFDSSINEHFMNRLRKKEAEAKPSVGEVDVVGRKIAETEKTEVVEPETPYSSVGGGEVEKVPDIFDLIFSISSEIISSHGPKVICLEELKNDSHLGALRTLCMRIYREKVGGKPEPIIISNIKRDEFQREIERWMKAEDRIFSVELDNVEGLDRDFWHAIRDRIEELFSQRFGFIIFNKPIRFVPYHHVVSIINIKPREMGLELKKEIASMIWGFVKIDDVSSPLFDHIFEAARKEFEARLRSIGEPYLTATKRDKYEADDLHYPIKLFLVKYLSKEMGLKDLNQIRSVIKTEFEELGNCRPDIYVLANNNKFANQVFEVETLFGQGDYPLKKIDETVEKYEKVPQVYKIKKVNIVMDNLALLMHIRELKKKLELHRDLQARGERKFDLEFYALDLQNEKLVTLQEVIERLRELKRRME